MNLELLESFGQNYPEDSDGTLDCVSMAVTCAFNKHGTLLAVGCNDGRIVVWDFLTRGIAKVINAHIHPICSISWNKSGYKLISASTDSVVSIWDLLTGDCDRTFRFPSPVLKVQFHPRDRTYGIGLGIGEVTNIIISNNRFLVCPMRHAAIIMNIDGTHKIVPLEDETDLNIVAAFDRRGHYIYTGNAKGKIMVFDTDALELKASFRVTTTTSSTTALKSIEFARRGNCFLVNSADRIIRVYESGEVLACGKEGEPEPIQKLQDLVNRSLWKKCCFSGDGEYIVAGSARQHSLYIWEKSSGNLVKFLLGTKGETLLDVVWHPVRPIIASISSGVVSIWAQNQVENWSAYAPDFKELDENVEYDERESEFDVEDEDKEIQETKGPFEEDVEVDVTTVDPVAAFLSSDEDDDDRNALLYLPISPEIEEAEDALGAEQQMLPEEAAADRKRATGSAKETSASPKKRKTTKVIDVVLPNAPVDEVHPMLTAKKPPVEKQPRRVGGAVGAANKGKTGKVTKADAKVKQPHRSVDAHKENAS